MKWKNGILHDYTNKNTIFFLVTLKMCFITVRRVLLISKKCSRQAEAIGRKQKGGEKMIYSDKVMDHFMNPRNVGKIEDADGVGEVGNAKLQYSIQLQ